MAASDSFHAAAQALESLQIINQPVASIAKKEEILYVLGQEDEPIVLEQHSPVLHLIQQIRDETHRLQSRSPTASREAANANSAQRDPWRGGKDGAETIEGIWERCQYSEGGAAKVEQRYFTEKC